MLDLKQVDLASLAEALEDHSDFTEWWLDPATGQVEPWPSDFASLDDVDEEHPSDREWRSIEPVSSRESYSDMEDFIERVRDSRARDLLRRAIEGRGAFRRFKDVLLDFPELRTAWFTFHDARMERRAIEWLLGESLVDAELAEGALAERKDPDLPAIAGAFDADDVARSVAADLRGLYGDRLREVVLFGSWARGDAHPESDIDLLVVLDLVASPWEELRRMDSILDFHSVANDTVVSAVVVPEAQFAQPVLPVLIRASREGRPVV